MKKIIALLLASVMLSGCVNASSAPDYSVPTPLYGNYYLNGDVESGAYLELTEETIVMKGDRVEEYLTDGIIKTLGEEITQDIIDDNLEDQLELYTVASDYVVSYVGTEEVPYAILNRWNKDAEVKNNRYGGSGFWYNGTDTLSLNNVGDFIYVKE